MHLCRDTTALASGIQIFDRGPLASSRSARNFYRRTQMANDGMHVLTSTLGSVHCMALHGIAGMPGARFPSITCTVSGSRPVEWAGQAFPYLLHHPKNLESQSYAKAAHGEESVACMRPSMLWYLLEKQGP